jgi:hypothetical protein
MIRYLTVLPLVAITAFAASVAYYYANPASAITGIWESTSYFEARKGEYITRSRIDIEGRNLTASALIYDSKNHLAAKRVVTMRLQRKARLSRSNVFTLKIDYPRQFAPSTDPAIESQLHVFRTIQLRLYLLDCNHLIIDSNPRPRLGYSMIYSRSIPITCSS